MAKTGSFNENIQLVIVNVKAKSFRGAAAWGMIHKYKKSSSKQALLALIRVDETDNYTDEETGWRCLSRPC